MLQGLTLEDRQGESRFTETLKSLHWRLYASRSDDDWQTAIEALWLAGDAEDGPAVAWQTTLSALFRDPAFVSY